MLEKNKAFDDFVDDCFIDKDPICNISKNNSLEIVASQLISELVEQNDEIKVA